MHLEGVGGRGVGGNMNTRGIDVGNYFECRGNGSGEIGRWMMCKHVILGHDFLKWNCLGKSEKQWFS